MYRKELCDMRDAAPVSIYLLRHGDVEGGRCYRGKTDDPLTAAGWEQMWRSIRSLPRFERLIASPLARCSDFARALAERDSVPLRLDVRLQEIDFGAWEGRTAADIMETEPVAFANFWQDPWRHGPPGAEPLNAMQARVLAAWCEITAQPHTTLVVTHGGPIRVILADVLGLSLEKLLQAEIAHAAVYSVQIDESGTLRTEALTS
jgi:alpha-ribazole phosphatase